MICSHSSQEKEKDLVHLEIETGDAAPKRQPVRRVPSALHHEVSQQHMDMQASGVIQPS